jgi:hypothetical protein
MHNPIMVANEKVMISIILLYLRKRGVTIKSIDRQFRKSRLDNPMKKKSIQRINTMIVV